MLVISVKKGPPRPLAHFVRWRADFLAMPALQEAPFLKARDTGLNMIGYITELFLNWEVTKVVLYYLVIKQIDSGH